MLREGTERTHISFTASRHCFRIALLAGSHQFSKLPVSKTTSFQDSFAGGMQLAVGSKDN
jgi:hypothetical protein